MWSLKIGYSFIALYLTRKPIISLFNLLTDTELSPLRIISKVTINFSSFSNLVWKTLICCIAQSSTQDIHPQNMHQTFCNISASNQKQKCVDPWIGLIYIKCIVWIISYLLWWRRTDNTNGLILTEMSELFFCHYFLFNWIISISNFMILDFVT